LSAACALTKIAADDKELAMKFEDAGRALDQGLANLLAYFDKEVKPTTKHDMAELLRKTSVRLAKMAEDLEGRNKP